MSQLIKGMVSAIYAILPDCSAPIVSAPTPLEIQMAEQLKEQSRQMEEMKQMMASLLEAEEVRKAEKARMAEEAYKAEEVRKAEKARKAEEVRMAEEARKADEAYKADEACKRKEKAWSCPNDGTVRHWTHSGKLYARNFTNEVWNCNGNIVTTWMGIYVPALDRIVKGPEPIYLDEYCDERKTRKEREAEAARKQREDTERKQREDTERKQREAAEHSMRQEEARKRSAARIQAGEYSIWMRYQNEHRMGTPQELITKGGKIWASDRTPITVDGKVCVGPRLGEYMGIDFGSIHFSLCGISRNCYTHGNGVTYDGRVEPKLY